MPTITGPSIQMPAAGSKIQDEGGRITPAWAPFLHSVQQTTFNASRSGPTASRPTSALDGRWIGMPFFDTTLGIAIWLSAVNPDVWVRWDGTAV